MSRRSAITAYNDLWFARYADELLAQHGGDPLLAAELGWYDLWVAALPLPLFGYYNPYEHKPQHDLNAIAVLRSQLRVCLSPLDLIVSHVLRTVRNEQARGLSVHLFTSLPTNEMTRYYLPDEEVVFAVVARLARQWSRRRAWRKLASWIDDNATSWATYTPRFGTLTNEDVQQERAQQFLYQLRLQLPAAPRWRKV